MLRGTGIRIILSLLPELMKEQNTYFIFTLSLLLIAAVTAMNLVVPLGFTIWLFYIVPLLLVAWKATRNQIILVAGVSVLGLIAGFFIAPKGIDPVISAFNRLIGLVILFITTILFIRNRNYLEKLKKSDRRFRATFEQAAVGIAHHSPTGEWLDVNQKFCEILGYSKQELVGKTFQDFTYYEDAGKNLGLTQQVLEGTLSNYSLEKRYVHKDGRIIWVNKTVSLVRDSAGNPEYFIAVVEDISARKEMEESLKNTISALNSSNKELERFAYIASHDLQEPLRMIGSYTQLLAKRYKGRLDQDADEFINYAVEGANRMKQLINDLLTFSRFSLPGNAFEWVNLEAVYSAAVSNLHSQIMSSSAVISHEQLPTVPGDFNQLVQLFQNLLSNAIKFRGAKAPEINICCEEKENDWLFSVQDNGIGIESKYAERIFIVFQRLHTQAQFPGTGIGLAISHKVVHRHGGRIWVESEPGHGSTFYFTISKNMRQR